MHGIYISALLTSLIAAVGFGTIIRRTNQPAHGRLLCLAALVTLPLQPLAFYLVRNPLDHWIVAYFDRSSASYLWLTSLYAPLTEEPAKLVALLIPVIFRDIRPANFVRYSLAIGVSFAIGEMWFVAERIARQPTLAALPFFAFTGYAIERLMTCIFHSAFVAITLSQLRLRFAPGFSGAVLAHWLGNFPILLMTLNVGGLGKTVWTVLIQLYLLVILFIALALLRYFSCGQVSVTRMIYGLRHCPECDRDYDPPLLAVNFGRTRYERCPHCKQWHWTKALSGQLANHNTER